MLAVVPATGDGHRKKLIEAAQLWARGLFVTEEEHEKQDEEVAEALASFGLRLDRTQAAEPDAQPFYLWPENVAPWSLFLACVTQWRHDDDGPRGLDYPGVEAIMRAHRVRTRRWRQRWNELQAMERACLAVWRERAQ